MDIINYLGVMADSIESFMESITLLEALYIVATFIGLVFLVLSTHILLGIKSLRASRANGVSRYFEHHYLGTYIDGKKFLRRKRFSMNRRAREEFALFLSSNSNIKDTDFVRLMMLRTDGSLGMTMGVFNIAIVVAMIFILIKSYVSNIYGVEAMLFVGLSLIAMLVVKLVIYGTIRYVCHKVDKATLRLDRAIENISYNNEYRHVVTRDDIDEKITPNVVKGVDAEQVISRMQEAENSMDGETQEMVLESINSIKDCLGDTEREKYQEVLDKYGISLE